MASRKSFEISVFSDLGSAIVANGLNLISEIMKPPRLHRATVEGDIEVVRFLIEKGGDVNAKDILDETPLHIASRNGHVEVAQVLLAHGADLTVKNKNGKTPIDLAKNDEMRDLLSSTPSISLFIKGDNVEVTRKRLLTESEEVLKAIKDDNSSLESLMGIAVKNKNEEMLKILIKAGFNVNSVGKFDGETLTPLMLALKLKVKTLVQLLLQNGADPRFQDSNGDVFDSLEYAHSCGALDLLEALTPNQDIIDFNDLLNIEDKKEELKRAKEVSAKIGEQEDLLQSHEENIDALKARSVRIKEEIRRLQDEDENVRAELGQRQNEKVAVFRSVMELRFSYDFRLKSEISKLSKAVEDARMIENAVQQRNSRVQDDPRECPICFSEANQAYSCFGCDNWFCQGCEIQLTRCPHCRQDFSNRRPQRNLLIERYLRLNG